MRRRCPPTCEGPPGPLQDVTVNAFGAVGRLVTVLSVAFRLMLNGLRYVGMALRLPGQREARYRRLVTDINQAVARYTLGDVAISVLATTATWLVLSMLGRSRRAVTRGRRGLLRPITLVGATIGAIVVALATLSVELLTATIV